MSKNKMITVRVQSAEGTKRLDVEPSDTTCDLIEKVRVAFGLDSDSTFALHRERSRTDEVHSSKSRTVRACGLRHGDMLYLSREDGGGAGPSTATPSVSTVVPAPAPTPTPAPQEDDVDLQLWKLDGKVERARDDKLCRHGPNGCCVHCSPLEPFDEEHLRRQNVKHLSFHGYLRKLTSGADRGKFVALEEASCRVRAGCKDHPPWPRGICSKCQPGAVTLSRQPYRHVDHVMFENARLVERFLHYWRGTGHQRVGLLYGRYERHNDVPLGIRAVVAAIYEPPQEGARDAVRLLPDTRRPLVDRLAAALGLRPVGWIFTDLLPQDVQRGTVRHLRHAATHFLSAQECITAAHFQSLHPNPCRYAAASGHFGSKFVTVCVTGDASNQVHMEGYQVSNQCVALVRDGCLVPTRDAPELGYVRESTDKQYVPDVFYKEKDGYGNEVPRLARPLPVEYLLVDVPTSTPITPHYTFNPDTTKRQFPVENRLVDGHIQDFNALASYLAQFSPPEFLTAMSDFHLLLYVATMDMLPMREYMEPLLEAVRTRDADLALEWSRSEHWATVEQLIAASNTSPPGSRPASAAADAAPADPQPPGALGGAGAELWTCPYCTFLNSSDVHVCDMCRLPRSAAHH